MNNQKQQVTLQDKLTKGIGEEHGVILALGSQKTGVEWLIHSFEKILKAHLYFFALLHLLVLVL